LDRGAAAPGRGRGGRRAGLCPPHGRGAAGPSPRRVRGRWRGPRASVEALDPQAQAWLDDKIARHVGDEAAGDDGAGEARALRLDDVPFEPDIPTLRSAPSQLDRDQALARWKTIVQDTADEECGARRSETVRYRSCRDEVERALFPYSGVAVTCLLSDNAVPDYVSGLDQDDAPSHSVLLGKGALLLCDAALPNL
jgi:hypothetical protein